MSKTYWIAWGKAAGVRAIKTAAQSALGVYWDWLGIVFADTPEQHFHDELLLAQGEAQCMNEVLDYYA